MSHGCQELMVLLVGLEISQCCEYQLGFMGLRHLNPRKADLIVLIRSEEQKKDHLVKNRDSGDKYIKHLDLPWCGSLFATTFTTTNTSTQLILI